MIDGTTFFSNLRAELIVKHLAAVADSERRGYESDDALGAAIWTVKCINRAYIDTEPGDDLQSRLSRAAHTTMDLTIEAGLDRLKMVGDAKELGIPFALVKPTVDIVEAWVHRGSESVRMLARALLKAERSQLDQSFGLAQPNAARVGSRSSRPAAAPAKMREAFEAMCVYGLTDTSVLSVAKQVQLLSERVEKNSNNPPPGKFGDEGEDVVEAGPDDSDDDAATWKGMLGGLLGDTFRDGPGRGEGLSNDTSPINWINRYVLESAFIEFEALVGALHRVANDVAAEFPPPNETSWNQALLPALETLAQAGVSELGRLLDPELLSEWNVEVDQLGDVFQQKMIKGRAIDVLRPSVVAIVGNQMECADRLAEIRDEQLRCWADLVVNSRQTFVDEGKRTSAGVARTVEWVDGDGFFQWMSRGNYPKGLNAAYHYRAAVMIALVV